MARETGPLDRRERLVEYAVRIKHFTAAFSGRLGSLDQFRFRPMLAIEKGVAYRLEIEDYTGKTKMYVEEPQEGGAHESPDALVPAVRARAE